MQWSGGEDGLHALRVLLRAQAVGVRSRRGRWSSARSWL